MSEKKGVLYLLPAPLDTEFNYAVLPQQSLDIIAGLDEFIVEEEKTARRFLKKLDRNRDIDKVVFHLYNEHSDAGEIPGMLAPIFNGKNIGILSEAGLPCIADPGAAVVACAHAQFIKVVPLSGPSSIILALISAGFNGQNFSFNGYLPIDKSVRERRIRELETLALTRKQTQIFMETPYRNNQMLESILKICKSETMLCIAACISMPNEFIRTMSIADWRLSVPDLNKKPCVFVIGKSQES
jgi:16S rRNA (cytidine1402-2'-O)-methyltransferase